MALKHLWLLVLGLCGIGCGKSDMTACPPWRLCGVAVTAAGVPVTPSATPASNAPPTGGSIVNPGAAAAAAAEPKVITLLPATKAKPGGRGGGGYSSGGRGRGGGGYSSGGHGTTRASEPAQEKRANGAKCMDDKECESGSCNAHYVCQGDIE